MTIGITEEVKLITLLHKLPFRLLAILLIVLHLVTSGPVKDVLACTLPQPLPLPVSYGIAGGRLPHAVTQYGTTTVNYDANGNVLHKGTLELTYDTENRLITTNNGTGRGAVWEKRGNNPPKRGNKRGNNCNDPH